MEDSDTTATDRAGVAQTVEQPPRKRTVAGSIPAFSPIRKGETFNIGLVFALQPTRTYEITGDLIDDGECITIPVREVTA
jgi:hypothetical protein